jgi:hypothetical protein
MAVAKFEQRGDNDGDERQACKQAFEEDELSVSVK